MGNPGTATVHADICLPLELGGQPFEAVGFLPNGTRAMRGNEVIACTDNGRHVRTDGDWQFVYEHRHELPEPLTTKWLITAHPYQGDQEDICYLYNDLGAWHDARDSLHHKLHGNALVLRRRAA